MAEQAPSADATNEPVAAAADPSLHKHSSHKHSSQKEILSELLSIADIPVASHKPSSSSSHHHSRHHATPTTVVDPMHIKVAAEHLKAARQHQIIEEDASGSATGSSPPKQRIRNRIAASANANASLDSFLTTPGDNSQSGNQTAGDGSVSANANEGSGVASVSGLEEMFPSYSGHAKANAVTETVANVAELKIKDASTSGKNDEGETRESNVGSEDAQPSASAVADTTPQPRGSAAASVNVETSEVLAAIRLWGANTGAANAARNADSAFLQPYQGSSYSSYVDDHRTSPSVAREARAREELAKLERSRSKSYPELAELDKAATVPKIKALGGMRSGEKSKDAAMDKLGIGQEDSEYADTEYFGWLLSGGSKFAKPSNTRQDLKGQSHEVENASISQTTDSSPEGVQEASDENPPSSHPVSTRTKSNLNPETKCPDESPFLPSASTTCEPCQHSSNSSSSNSSSSSSSSSGEANAGRGVSKSESKANSSSRNSSGDGWLSAPFSRHRKGGRKGSSGSSLSRHSMTLGESSRAEVTKRRRSLDMKEVLTKEVPTEEIAPVGLAANAAPTRAGGDVEVGGGGGSEAGVQLDVSGNLSSAGIREVARGEEETASKVPSKWGFGWWGLLRKRLTVI